MFARLHLIMNHRMQRKSASYVRCIRALIKTRLARFVRRLHQDICSSQSEYKRLKEPWLQYSAHKLPENVECRLISPNYRLTSPDMWRCGADGLKKSALTPAQMCCGRAVRASANVRSRPTQRAPGR
eukprot:6214141-Pleurochrysis_carterae.AAC.5